MEDECAWISRLIGLLNTTIPLVWMCVGTCTNLLSLLVFMRSKMRSNSTFFYLTLMTASDLIVIWLTSFRDFMAYKFDFYVSGAFACKAHVFSFFLFAQFSSWMLAAASFDRLVLVVTSHKSSLSKMWCTKSTAIRLSSILFVFFCALNFHFLLNVSSVDNTANSTTVTLINPIVYKLCKAKPGFYSDFYTKYYSWIDAFMYSFLPFLIMCVCNYILIKKVFKSKRNLYKSNGRKDINNNQPPSLVLQNEQELSLLPNTNGTPATALVDENVSMTTSKPTIVKFSVSTMAEPSLQQKRLSTVSLDPNQLQQISSSNSNSNSNIANNNSSNSNSNIANNNSNNKLAASMSPPSSQNIPQSSMEKMRNMAITIIGVTVLFIVFTVPINIYIPFMHLSDPNVKHCDDLIFCVLNNMVNANHSTSFFIYLTTNFKFKREIESIWTSFLICIGLRKVQRSNARSASFSRISTSMQDR